MKDLEAILEHAKAALSEGEFATLKGAVQTLAFLTRELEKKSVSVQRLRQLLFGASTETTAKVIEKILQHCGLWQPPRPPPGGNVVVRVLDDDVDRARELAFVAEAGWDCQPSSDDVPWEVTCDASGDTFDASF